MISPSILLKFDADSSILNDFLNNIGSLASDASDANVILTDNSDYVSEGYINFVLTDDFGNGYISIPAGTDPQTIYQMIMQSFSVLSSFGVVNSESCEIKVSHKEEEIIAGFARHFSHNVLNALLVTSGFTRQIKANTEMTKQMTMLWGFVDSKLNFIEELVRGYSDYYQVLNLTPDKDTDVTSFFVDLIPQLADKSFERSFAACLNNHTNAYTLSYEFFNTEPRIIKASPLFLKMAFSYILKDTIRYASSTEASLNFFVKAGILDGRLHMLVKAVGISIAQDIIETMFRPWEHDMFVHSFDYWGIAIAKIVIEKHGGELTVSNIDKDLCYKIVL